MMHLKKVISKICIIFGYLDLHFPRRRYSESLMRALKISRKEERSYRNILTKFLTPNKCSEVMPFATSSNNQRSKPSETKNWKPSERKKPISHDS